MISLKFCIPVQKFHLRWSWWWGWTSRVNNICCAAVPRIWGPIQWIFHLVVTFPAHPTFPILWQQNNRHRLNADTSMYFSSQYKENKLCEYYLKWCMLFGSRLLNSKQEIMKNTKTCNTVSVQNLPDIKIIMPKLTTYIHIKDPISCQYNYSMVVSILQVNWYWLPNYAEEVPSGADYHICRKL